MADYMVIATMELYWYWCIYYFRVLILIAV